jgi:hypothetical protein
VDLGSLQLDLLRVRSGIVSAPGDWPWSSYAATVGEIAPAPAFLQAVRLLRAFAGSREEAVVGYRRFVTDGIGTAGPWHALKSRIYLGSEQVVERIQALINPQRALREIPKRQRSVVYRAIAAAYVTCAFSMQAIADHFGVGRMTVSRAVKRSELAAVRANGTWET